ncbi:exocyst complex component Sec10-like protein [Artemisia annua]|uniref:Exocyst complex component Sec10-like protein n=1 Tax=Artemisia annua TaxID=35608 RepID=A0A2U1KUR7_ARTAN|nr:exocyst complex component Sec10-like protein [Artemisia annua]
MKPNQAERLLTAEQKATDYRSVDDSLMSCSISLTVSRVLESAYTAVEGLNKQSFLTELSYYYVWSLSAREGNRLHKVLTTHWPKFSFNASGGLKLKHDINEYGDFLQNFNTPTVDEKFESLSIMANIFFVAPESL